MPHSWLPEILRTWLSYANFAIAEDLMALNQRLRNNGRPDLQIESRPDVGIVSHPTEPRGTNFNAAFHMIVGVERAPGQDALSPATYRNATAADIEALRDMPRIESYEHYKELRDSGRYAALYDLNHASHPPFLRMLTAFPDFTLDFVGRRNGDQSHTSDFMFEEFIAYQLMFRMIDNSDWGYRLADGTPDPWCYRR